MMIKWIRKFVNISVCLGVSAFVLTGCGREAEWFSFSDTAGLSEAADVKAEEYSELAGKDLAAESLTESESAELMTEERDATLAEEQIVIYLCGAVKCPGVYALKSDSRINDAVEAAGGLTDDAAAASVNLAKKLEDADMIYIPTKEEVKQQNPDAAGSLYNGPVSTGADMLININTADMYTLCSLPGIGESKARDIITYREKNGAFQKKEDIMKVSGIKTSLYEKISSLISVK